MQSFLKILRWTVGLLFIFSGLIKANDPLGLSYKMQEFLSKLTIKELKLQDKPFDPEKEFKKKQFRVLY